MNWNYILIQAWVITKRTGKNSGLLVKAVVDEKGSRYGRYACMAQIIVDYLSMEKELLLQQYYHIITFLLPFTA